MDAATLTTMIGSLGFPICCTIYLIYTIRENEAKHAEIEEKLRQTIENNTKAMIKICTKLGIEEE